jgi:hypothetical protein
MVEVLGEAGIYFMVIFVVHIRRLISRHYRTTVLLPACLTIAWCEEYEPQYILSLPLTLVSWLALKYGIYSNIVHTYRHGPMVWSDSC